MNVLTKHAKKKIIWIEIGSFIVLFIAPQKFCMKGISDLKLINIRKKPYYVLSINTSFETQKRMSQQLNSSFRVILATFVLGWRDVTAVSSNFSTLLLRKRKSRIDFRPCFFYARWNSHVSSFVCRCCSFLKS